MSEPAVDRRRALTLLGGAGLAAVVTACGSSARNDASATTTSSTSPSTTAASASASKTPSTITPEETAGPYPGDGSNGPDVLNQSGIVRSDIRSSFGSYSGSAEGVPLTITFKVVDVDKTAPLANAGIYVWHCDRDGRYSLYTLANQNYLRGVQATGADGSVTFTSTYPGCYAGRWPHIHFEVYENLAAATAGKTKLKTSQIALPEDASKLVYATSGYEQSVTNLKQVSLASDNVFSDGWSSELGTVTGTVNDGLHVTLAVGV